MIAYKVTERIWEMIGPTNFGRSVAFPSAIVARLIWRAFPMLDLPILWKAEGDLVDSSPCLVRCTNLKTLKIVPFPNVTTEQCVRIAIACARIGYKEQKWTTWAARWLNGRDRSADSAKAARISIPADSNPPGAWAASEAAFLYSQDPPTVASEVECWAAHSICNSVCLDIHAVAVKFLAETPV